MGSAPGETVPSLIYLLCVVTSAGCAVLLMRAYRRVRSPVLFWTGLSLILLTLNNLLVVAAFFLRFWRDTGDRLFLAFAAGFALLAANYALPTLLRAPGSDLEEAFVLRAAAFLTLGAAVLWRIWPRRR